MKPLHLLVGDHPSRPETHYIVVKNQFVYVTNGAALVKIPVKKVFGDCEFIEEEEILIFEAKKWSLLKFHTAKIINREGLIFKNLTFDTEIKALTLKDVSFKLLDYESVMPSEELNPIESSHIGLNPKLLADIAKVFGANVNAISLQFYGLDRAFEILIPDFYDCRVILYPCIMAAVEGLKEPYRHVTTEPPAPTVKVEPVVSKTKQPVGKIKVKRDELIDITLELLKKHVDTTRAILDDYMLGDEDCRMELAVAQDNLKDEISEMEVEYTYPKLLEMVKDHDDYNSSDLLELLIKEEGEICLREALQGRGYAIIKIDNILDQSKLQTFVETELYPNYCDRDKYSI
jgi:hypothetical protein